MGIISDPVACCSLTLLVNTHHDCYLVRSRCGVSASGMQRLGVSTLLDDKAALEDKSAKELARLAAARIFTPP